MRYFPHLHEPYYDSLTRRMRLLPARLARLQRPWELRLAKKKGLFVDVARGAGLVTFAAFDYLLRPKPKAILNRIHESVDHGARVSRVGIQII